MLSELTRNLEVDGYIRSMQVMLHPLIIPCTISRLIDLFYDPWIKLKNIPHSLPHVYRITSMYHNSTNNKDYFILCPLHEDSRNVYIYDCIVDEWNVLTTYPTKFDPICQGTVINPIHEELIIFGGQTQIFGIYNLKSNEWKIICDSGDKVNKFDIPRYSNPASIWMTEPINQLHAIIGYRDINAEIVKWDYDFYHMTIDKHQKFINVSDKTLTYNFCDSSLVNISIENKQYLMLIGGCDHNFEFGDDIFYCQLTGNNYEWKLFQTKLPYKERTECVVVFGQILIAMFYEYIHEKNEKKCDIYFLEIQDMENNNNHNNKWIWCHDVKISVPCEMRMRGNWIHFINATSAQMHKKIHISRLLPYQLFHKYV